MIRQVDLQQSSETGVLFTLKDVIWSPKTPSMKQPFTIKGKIDLFGIIYLAPVWVIAHVTYPETFWEEILPIIGSPKVSEVNLVIGGNFKITFANGFLRQGEYILRVEVHAGPTIPVSSFTIPPFPPLAYIDTKFTVSGGTDEAEQISGFDIISYAKGSGTPVNPPDVLELAVGDTLRVKVGGSHAGAKIGGTLRVAMWKPSLLDPHNEILFATKPNSIPASADLTPFEETVDIPITSAVKPSSQWGLYAKISGITGADVYTGFLENVIKIAGGVAPGQGAITSKWINKSPEGNKIPLPTTVTADGNTFEIGVQAKNTSTVVFTAGIEIKVYDPDNVLRFSPAVNYAGMSPGEELLWGTYNVCKVDKAGAWTIKLRFLTKTAGVVLDEKEFIMTATTVSANWLGVITSAFINKGSQTKLYLPQTVVADGKTFEIAVYAKNTSIVEAMLGVEIKVYDPDNNLVFTHNANYTHMAPNEELPWGAFNVAAVTKAGTWRVDARFLSQDGKLLDSKSFVMTATAVSAQYTGTITSAYINKGSGTYLYLPYTVKADGQTFEIVVNAKSTSVGDLFGGVEIKIYDPDNALVFTHQNYTHMSLNEELSWGAFNVVAVTKVGNWRVDARFLENTTGKVLDTESFIMTATSTGAVPSTVVLTLTAVPDVGFIEASPVGTPIAGGYSYSIGTIVQVTAYAYNSNYFKFDYWSPDILMRSGYTVNPNSVQMTQDINLQAIFVAVTPPPVPGPTFPAPGTVGDDNYWYWVVFTDNSAAW